MIVYVKENIFVLIVIRIIFFVLSVLILKMKIKSLNVHSVLEQIGTPLTVSVKNYTPLMKILMIVPSVEKVNTIAYKGIFVKGINQRIFLYVTERKFANSVLVLMSIVNNVFKLKEKTHSVFDVQRIDMFLFVTVRKGRFRTQKILKGVYLVLIKLVIYS